MKGLYLVTDQTSCKHHDLETVVSESVKAGISFVQLREKTADTRTFLNKALTLKAVLEPAGIPLIINDRVDIALASKAKGVHIGQSDMPYEITRKLMGPDAIIGLSVETWDDVTAAQDMSVDYIGVSPVFYTPTKTDIKEPWELAGLKKIKAYSRHPLVAIGGINSSNIASVIKAGADSIAMVSAICSAKNPFNATKHLCNNFNQLKTSQEKVS
jgi:thiamine-phosphate pyrophosphorylase